MSFENPILTIEKAIIDRLQKAVNCGVLGYIIPVIASFSGEGDDDIPPAAAKTSTLIFR